LSLAIRFCVDPRLPLFNHWDFPFHIIIDSSSYRIYLFRGSAIIQSDERNISQLYSQLRGGQIISMHLGKVYYADVSK